MFPLQLLQDVPWYAIFILSLVAFNFDLPREIYDFITKLVAFLPTSKEIYAFITKIVVCSLSQGSALVWLVTWQHFTSKSKIWIENNMLHTPSILLPNPLMTLYLELAIFIYKYFIENTYLILVLRLVQKPKFHTF